MKMFLTDLALDNSMEYICFSSYIDPEISLTTPIQQKKEAKSPLSGSVPSSAKTDWDKCFISRAVVVDPTNQFAALTSKRLVDGLNVSRWA